MVNKCLFLFTLTVKNVHVEVGTLLTLLRILFFGRIGSISYVLPILSRDIRVVYLSCDFVTRVIKKYLS